MHPGEALAYVTDSGRNEVVTVDLDHRTIVSRVPVPGPARHISVDAGQRRRLDGVIVRATRVPHGSYNVACATTDLTGGRAVVVTPSLERGTVAVLETEGRVQFVRRITRSAHDACIVRAG